MSDGKRRGRGWLFLLVQLPASPSSARVTLWRRLRAAGAAGLQNGVWVLPKSSAHAKLFERLLGTAREQGGTGFVLTGAARTAEDAEAIAARFRADRAREYDEFSERCTDLLGEIDKETRRRKFTFAELEEIEQDLEKLAGWLGKIGARDFSPDQRAGEAIEALGRCREAAERFARAVYESEGIGEARVADGEPEADAVAPSASNDARSAASRSRRRPSRRSGGQR